MGDNGTWPQSQTDNSLPSTWVAWCQGGPLPSQISKQYFRCVNHHVWTYLEPGDISLYEEAVSVAVSSNEISEALIDTHTNLRTTESPHHYLDVATHHWRTIIPNRSAMDDLTSVARALALFSLRFCLCDRKVPPILHGPKYGLMTFVQAADRSSATASEASAQAHAVIRSLRIDNQSYTAMMGLGIWRL